MTHPKKAAEIARRIHTLTNSAHGCRMEFDLVQDIEAILESALREARIEGGRLVWGKAIDLCRNIKRQEGEETSDWLRGTGDCAEAIRTELDPDSVTNQEK